jgi:hypothetical protein
MHSIDNTLKLVPWPDVTHEVCGMSVSCQNKRRLFHSLSLLSTTSITLSMLFRLFLYSLTQSDPGDASPIPSITSIKPRADFSCHDLNNCRTISSIVWSCLSTIFLCTWVSLHPNITAARNRGVMGWLHDFTKNKLPLFLCALLAPEYILGWAIRQYLRAGNIQQQGGFLLVPARRLLNSI